jgi:hypothetical protein
MLIFSDTVQHFGATVEKVWINADKPLKPSSTGTQNKQKVT